MTKLATRRASLAIGRAAADPSLPRYLRYWRTIAPRDDREYFQRWLFAFASIRTRWQVNVSLYNALARPGTSFVREPLRALLVAERSGMVEVRTEGLSRFCAEYWLDPRSFRPAPGEPFAACRDRLVGRIHGLGIAKVSFALELCYPQSCDVACLDTHLLRLYGLAGEAGVADSVYRAAESHWRASCARRGVPSPIARHMYWDRVQGMADTRYWSHVFERRARKAG
jgi:hypothetical protein